MVDPRPGWAPGKRRCKGRRIHGQGTTSRGECPPRHRSRTAGSSASVDDLLMQNKTVKLTLLILKINKLLYPHCAHSCPSPSAQQELPESAASAGTAALTAAVVAPQEPLSQPPHSRL